MMTRLVKSCTLAMLLLAAGSIGAATIVVTTLDHVVDDRDGESSLRKKSGVPPHTANVTRLRRFSLGLLKSFQKSTESIAQTQLQPSESPRLSQIDGQLPTNGFGLTDENKLAVGGRDEKPCKILPSGGSRPEFISVRPGSGRTICPKTTRKDS